MNPFKFGTIVEGQFFTDRVEKLAVIKAVVSSENHLVLISPRRFGKSSIVAKAVAELQRPCISINLQSVSSSLELSRKLIRETLKRHPIEKVKRNLAALRIVPTISLNPLNDNFDISFSSQASSELVLEDAFDLIEKTSAPNNRTIVVFDEFQEIMEIEKGLDKKLRAIMQGMHNVNFIMLGSQESLMTEIFSKKKSPFYHFGEHINLPKLPYAEFKTYIEKGLSAVCPEAAAICAEEILAFTDCHPYYGQQLSFHVWERLGAVQYSDTLVDDVCQRLVESRDLDFTRIWDTIARTDRSVLVMLVKGDNPLQSDLMPTSTAFSALKRLCKKGYLNKVGTRYELEDPFFKMWLGENML